MNVRKKASKKAAKPRGKGKLVVAELAGDTKLLPGHSIDARTLAEQYGIFDHNEQDQIDWVNDEKVQLPDPESVIKPFGWRLLIMPMRPTAISKGGILIPQTRRDTDQYLNYVGRLVSMGPLAFKHAKWGSMGLAVEDIPQVGDWLVYPIYQYTRIDFKGRKLILLNDDSFIATVPKGVSPWDFKLER